MEVSEETTAAEVYGALDIKPEDVAILLVNGRTGRPDAPLAEDDTVSIFPPVGGG